MKQTSLALATLALGLASFTLGCDNGSPSPTPAASAAPEGVAAPKPMEVVPASPPKVDLGPLPVPAMSAADLPADPASSAAPKAPTAGASAAPTTTATAGATKGKDTPEAASIRAQPHISPGPMAPRPAPPSE